MGRIEGKVAIVTGGAKGIGAVYAMALAGEGAKVVVADIVDGSAIVDQIGSTGGEAIQVMTDVSDEESIARMVETAVSTFGRIDILVSNAAIYAALEMKPFTEIDIAEWDRVLAVNVRGPFLCARAVIPHMRKGGWGRIINISSGTVFKGTPFLLHYVASKGAIIAMTRSLARELGDDGVCVNTLAPGFVLSDTVLANEELRSALTDTVRSSRSIKRDQVPEDLIGTLLFLASDDSRFVTGQAIVVDGGSVMH